MPTHNTCTAPLLLDVEPSLDHRSCMVHGNATCWFHVQGTPSIMGHERKSWASSTAWASGYPPGRTLPASCRRSPPSRTRRCDSSLKTKKFSHNVALQGVVEAKNSHSEWCLRGLSSGTADLHGPACLGIRGEGGAGILSSIPSPILMLLFSAQLHACAW